MVSKEPLASREAALCVSNHSYSGLRVIGRPPRGPTTNSTANHFAAGKLKKRLIKSEASKP